MTYEKVINIKIKLISIKIVCINSEEIEKTLNCVEHKRISKKMGYEFVFKGLTECRCTDKSKINP